MAYDLFYRLTTKWTETDVHINDYRHAAIALGLTQNVQPKTKERVKNTKVYMTPVVGPRILVGVYNTRIRRYRRFQVVGPRILVGVYNSP